MIKGSALSLLNMNNNMKRKDVLLIDALKQLKYRLYALMEKEHEDLETFTVQYAIHRTYFTGRVVYESKRIQVVEWKCADCGVILKSKHDKLWEKYNQIRKRGNLNAKPALWIRK